ncbi:MAG: transposase [Armatimonadetes bacterium]|nr:transposase [Armatimonadota bacterium]
MPSTFLALHVHIVFSTKGRIPYLEGLPVERMHAYLGGVIRTHGATPLCIGGVADHVHLLVGLRGPQDVSSLVREAKKSSNKWMREENGCPDFAWQEGYSAFSVSPERLDRVRAYVENQAKHHEKKDYRAELMELLRFAGIEFRVEDLE